MARTRKQMERQLGQMAGNWEVSEIVRTLARVVRESATSKKEQRTATRASNVLESAGDALADESL